MILGQPIMFGSASQTASIKVTGDIANTDTCYAKSNHNHIIPIGYTELESIEMSSAQYVNTGLYCSANYAKLEIIFTVKALSSNRYSNIIHSANSANSIWNGFIAIDKNNSNRLTLFLGTSAVNTTLNVPLNTEVTMTVECNNGTVTVTSSLGNYSGSYSGSFFTTASLYCNTVNFDGTHDTANASTIVKSIKFKNSASDQYTEVIPCKNSNDVVGVYNLTDETFYGNEGTGTITAGGELIAPIKKDAVWTSVPNPACHNLPSGYTEVEYIQSSGTQYIKTGIALSQGKFNAKVNFANVTSYKHMLSYYASGTNKIYFYVSTDSKLIFTYGSPTTTLGSISANIDYDINAVFKQGQQSFTLNGVTTTSTLSASLSAIEFYLFASHDVAETGGVYAPISMRLYHAEMYDINDVKQFEYIPCIRNSDNAVGVYDTVSQSFKSNNGTGSFTVGAVVPSTLDSWLVKKISHTGTWTVHWQNQAGTEVDEKDVLIDTITEYTVPINVYTEEELLALGFVITDSVGDVISTKVYSGSSLVDNRYITRTANNKYALFVGFDSNTYKGYSLISDYPITEQFTVSSYGDIVDSTGVGLTAYVKRMANMFNVNQYSSVVIANNSTEIPTKIIAYNGVALDSSEISIINKVARSLKYL